MRARCTSLVSAVVLGGLLASLSGCGGGGGNGPSTSGTVLDDPIVKVKGRAGTFSRTPQQANETKGAPPTLVETAITENHWFRLEVPFEVDPASVLSTDPARAEYSYLNGNMSVTDRAGNHLPGLCLVGGFDAQGQDRRGEPGVPQDIQGGVDLNTTLGTILYVADVDGDLTTNAAFGYADDGSGGKLEVNVTPPSVENTININLVTINGMRLSGFWKIYVGADGSSETRKPRMISIRQSERDPGNPDDPFGVSVMSEFIVQFSEPMIPDTVGRSAELNGFPFNGNMPIPPFGALPMPNSAILAQIGGLTSQVGVPFDCVPFNNNNLSRYRLVPLVNLPTNTMIQIMERALSKNQGGDLKDSARNLFRVRFDGNDEDGDDIPDGNNFTRNFMSGEGPGVANIPVCPEVVYWLPSVGRGIGAIDLNGWGITTNTPGINSPQRIGDLEARDRASLITMNSDLNLVVGIGVNGYSGTGSGFPPYNRYLYPVGSGGLKYGPDGDQTELNGQIWWGALDDPGNPLSPVPGINEGSAGFETLCRDSNGDVLLTGRDIGEVGLVSELIVGEFLDRVFWDSENFAASDTFHVSIYGAVPSLGTNMISDPPSPNPPPTRYWVGLQQLSVVLDQHDPLNTALVIEGEEVFVASTTGRAAQTGFLHLKSNSVRPDGPDETIFPHFPVGPGGQSATQQYTFSSRQQIGNYLYATDRENKVVHAINSNTMKVISSFTTPDPAGLALSPDGSLLWVTNVGDNSVSVVGADPTSPDFHTELARIRVGSGPKAIAVQPDNEDVLVCNALGNSISIIDQQALSVRKEVTALIDGPVDVVLTGRQYQPGTGLQYGWACGIYFGYVSNFSGNSVVVFESGPDGPRGIGHDNILGSLPTDESPAIIRPRGMCYSPFVNPSGYFAGGVFVTHKDDEGFGRVTHIQFTEQAQYGPLNTTSPPGFYVPPGFLDRDFAITMTWGNDVNNRLAGFEPTDVALTDFNEQRYHNKPAGAPNTGMPPLVPPKPEQTGFNNSRHHMRVVGVPIPAWDPDRLYVSFADSDVIQVLDPLRVGIVINSIEGTGTLGVKDLTVFWSQ